MPDTQKRQIAGRPPDGGLVARPPARPVESGAATTIDRLRLLRPFLQPESIFLGLDGGEDLTRAVAPCVRFAYVVDRPGVAPAHLLPANAGRLGSDLLSIPLPDESVTVAFSDGVIDRLQDWDGTRHLREVQRVLAPGGVYVCRTGPGSGEGAAPSAFRELAGRFDKAGFDLLGLRAGRFISFTFSAGWVKTLDGAFGRLPAALRRRLSWEESLRSLFGGTALVARKDTYCWVPAPCRHQIAFA